MTSLEHSPSIESTTRHLGQPQALLVRYRWLYWSSVPLLAILAYLPVIQVGFLADDFLGLDIAKRAGFDLSLMLPGHWPNFRPVSVLYYMGSWGLWGANPLPYHLIGLLLHAGTSIVLALLVADIVGRQEIGWLSGALFAVFPAHMEAAGWLAASPDPQAALFGLLSLWLFIKSWRSQQAASRVRLYSLSLVFYALSIFTKESFFSLIPLYPLAIWVRDRPPIKRHWLRMALLLIPFCLLVAANLAIRLAYMGSVGMYSNARTDYLSFFWDGVASYAGFLLSPINIVLLGGPVAQVVGAISAIMLIVGLVYLGRVQWRVLLFAGAWFLLSVAPVINLTVDKLTLSNNRYLYLPAAAYAITLAALLYTAIVSAQKWRSLSIGIAVALLVVGISFSWIQLRPWHTATLQADSLIDELARLVPPENRSGTMQWYVQDVPSSYQGVWLFRGGIGRQRHLLYNENVQVTTVPDAAHVSLVQNEQDTFAFRFVFDHTSGLFLSDYAAGIAGSESAPEGKNVGLQPTVWDFTHCTEGQTESWQTINAQSKCAPGKGLLIQPTNGDPQIVAHGLLLDPGASSARYVRLRVAVRYSHFDPTAFIVNQWFWGTSSNQFGYKEPISQAVAPDTNEHIYWTFLPAGDVEQPITGLRFDPINSTDPVEINWIAIDLVR
jgi:hypothetical protein